MALTMELYGCNYYMPRAATYSYMAVTVAPYNLRTMKKPIMGTG